MKPVKDMSDEELYAEYAEWAGWTFWAEDNLERNCMELLVPLVNDRVNTIDAELLARINARAEMQEVAK